MKVYLDSCVVIYLVEENQQFGPLVRRAIGRYPVANLRAEYGLKTLDALHLATAKYHNCEVFLTNDDRLKRVVGEMMVNALG